MPNLLTKDTSAEASQSEKLLSTPSSSPSVGKPAPHPDLFSLVPHCSFCHPSSYSPLGFPPLTTTTTPPPFLLQPGTSPSCRFSVISQMTQTCSELGFSLFPRVSSSWAPSPVPGSAPFPVRPVL